jgi:hypothetical protein
MFLPFFFLSEYFYCLYLFGSGSFHSRWGLVESRASITVNDVLFFIYLYSLCHIVSLRFLPFNRFSGVLFSSGATFWPVNYLTVHEKRQFWSSCIKSFFRDPWHMWCTAGEQSSTEDCKITHFTTMDITHLRIAYNSMKVRQCKLSKEQWFTLPASIFHAIVLYFCLQVPITACAYLLLFSIFMQYFVFVCLVFCTLFGLLIFGVVERSRVRLLCKCKLACMYLFFNPNFFVTLDRWNSDQQLE